jgi:hypothetical protein
MGRGLYDRQSISKEQEDGEYSLGWTCESTVKLV